jgi:hypothetical protein
MLTIALLATFPVWADEGMWLPEQLPKMKADLDKMGLQIPITALSDPQGAVLGSTVSLGNCSAAFVSADGLVVTNSHCVASFLDYIGDQKDVGETGFIAHDRSEEASFGPAGRIWVTQSFEDVTDKVTAVANKAVDDRDRYRVVDRAKKDLVAACEKDGSICDVVEEYGGSLYRLVKKVAFSDLRLVFVPPTAVSLFGGDSDNWRWPRHTPDFALFRVYVGKDGKPAPNAKDNVPYKPPHWLPVSPDGVKTGDLVMLAGYPAKTFRNVTATEAKHAALVRYPEGIDFYGDILNVLRAHARRSKAAASRTRSFTLGLSNTVISFQGMVDGFENSDIALRKSEREQQLEAWIGDKGRRRRAIGPDLTEMRGRIDAELQGFQRMRILKLTEQMPRLLGVARKAYRLAVEREKPDAERLVGFQDRDIVDIGDQFQQVGRSMYRPAERDVLVVMLQHADKLPDTQRIAPFDALVADSGGIEGAADQLFESPELRDGSARLALLSMRRAEFEASKDPWIKLAVALEKDADQGRAREEEFDGAMIRLLPTYFAALQDMERKRPMYPDADGTLRVSFGKVDGYSPAEAVSYASATSSAGMMSKMKAGDPDYNLPDAFLANLKSAPGSRWADPATKAIPLDFLTTLDNTGGNSGSPTVDAKGRLVGLVFDRNYEAMAADWWYDPKVTRSIHCDVRFLLWMLSNDDSSRYLLGELGVK